MKIIKILAITLLLLTSGALGLYFSYEHYQTSPSHLVEAHMPVYHSPVSFTEQLKGDPRAGEKIFQEFCSACHAKEPVISVNAPRIYDRIAWQDRSKLGIEVLLQITANGAGAMPARGGCFECSDEQLKETIAYMLNTVS